MGKTSPEYQREWRAKNREHTRAYMREYMKGYTIRPETAARKRAKQKERRKNDPRMKEKNTARYVRMRDHSGRYEETMAKSNLSARTGAKVSDLPAALVEVEMVRLMVVRHIRTMIGKRTGRKRRVGLDDNAMKGAHQ